jgi:hypothetical protein
MNQVPASDEDIRTTCESIKHLLVLWDMIFSLVHTEYPSVEDCDKTQEFIDTAISIGDRLGMSRTIKIHGCMSHIVSQMRRIPCGLSDFDENFMEQYHQKGAANDVRLKHVKNVEKKGNIVSARLRRSDHPGTKAAIQRMVDDHSKGKRKKTLESRERKINGIRMNYLKDLEMTAMQQLGHQAILTEKKEPHKVHMTKYSVEVLAVHH